jgi:hypothetical protein
MNRLEDYYDRYPMYYMLFHSLSNVTNFLVLLNRTSDFDYREKCDYDNSFLFYSFHLSITLTHKTCSTLNNIFCREIKFISSMPNEIFLDGICEIDDNTIQTYFSQFGSSITTYESHRHRPTNSCCFAFLTFVSPDTVNAILRQRPHSINHHSFFVKRSLPSSVCSFIERLLPVSSLFVNTKTSEEFDEGKLKSYFETYGHIIKFERDHKRERLLIEYDDYDSVDRIFLNKGSLPYDISIHKNILPRAQNTIEYHGTCRRKQTTDEKKKKRNHKEKVRVKYQDEQYQDLLQKTVENLTNCKAQLRNKENDFVILQIGMCSFDIK